MLTTSLDGLWVLQAVSGIEVLAPEIGLRPLLPSAECAHAALSHPAAADLLSAGAIDASGAVDQTLLEWLTVLSRREVALLLHAQTPGEGTEPDRVLLARFAQWWVSAERYGDAFRLGGLGIATCERSAGELISNHLERLCGRLHPAPVTPVTIDVSALLRTVRDGGTLRTLLAQGEFDAEQAETLMLAGDARNCAQATLVALQSGVDGPPGRSQIGPGTVTIIDTPRGRLLAEQVSRAGRDWMILGPGSSNQISQAVLAMMRRLPAQDDWHSHRKAV